MTKNFPNSEIEFFKNWPNKGLLFDTDILIYDKKLEAQHLPWLKKFEHRFSVQAGEKLKTLPNFTQLAEKICLAVAKVPSQKIRILACGGGSVGDVVGFLASSLHRGVDLIQIPTSFLAAVDSSHGGKNGLNSKRAKNQFGTFYFPKKILISERLLNSCSTEQFAEARAEALKILLLTKKNVTLNDLAVLQDRKRFTAFIPEFARLKMSIVNKDPFEKTNLRRQLNLGHTLAHVLEMKLGLSHGTAVGYGVRFAVEWSLQKYDWKNKKLLSELDSKKLWPSKTDLKRVLLAAKIQPLDFLTDKKRSGSGKITFVMLKDLAQPQLLSVRAEDIAKALAEYHV